MTSVRLVLTGLLTAGAVLACASDAATGPQWPELPSGAIAVQYDLVEEVHTTPISGIDDRRRVVIRTQTEWEAFWAEFAGNLAPRPDPPTIDFAEKMVVAATMGLRSTGGYSISVEGIFEDGGRLIVRVLETSPGPKCGTIQAVTSPATAVTVATSNNSAEFEEATLVAGCN